jgi:two-component system cell cycle sensor histidine kinase/response regulator CckA
VTLTLEASDRRQAQEALEQHVRERTGELRRTTAHLQTIIEESPLAMIELDQAGLVTTWNAAATALFGWTKDEVLGKELPYVPPGQEEVSEDLWTAVMSGAAPRNLELRRQKKDGALVDVNMWGSLLQSPTGQAVGSIGFFVDITKHKQLEDQLRQAHKMEGIGRLAGGVAHDFNNLLTVINGCATLALDQVRTEDPLRRSLTEILTAGQRAAALTKQLLAFSRRQVLTFQVFDLNEALSSISSMIERLIGEDINLTRNLDSRPCTIRADRGQIDQVVLNLAVNAKDAMPTGGTLTMATQALLITPDSPVPHPALLPGAYAHLSIRDSGQGMDRTTLSHIFEPFFTTKEEGKGTGLGLATVYGIVKQSQGFIFADSTPRRGVNLRPLLSTGGGAAACGHADTSIPSTLRAGDHPAGRGSACRPVTAHPGPVRLRLHPAGSLQRTGSAPPRRRRPHPHSYFAHGRRHAADDRTGLGRAPASAMARATGALYVGICRGERVTDVSHGTGHRLHSEALSPH